MSNRMPRKALDEMIYPLKNFYFDDIVEFLEWMNNSPSTLKWM